VIYAASTDGERDILIESIRDCLRDDGRLVIIDNDLVENEELPYHGPYITRNLIISQLWHYGFVLIRQYQFSVQRYVLEFKKTEIPEPDPSAKKPAFIPDPSSPGIIRVTSPSSLVRYRMLGISSQGFTLSGKKAARLFYTALEKQDAESVRAALKAYEDLIPKERIGDEYTAFQWFCQYLLSSPDQQAGLLTDRCTAEFFSHMAADEYAFLKTYLRIKYDLAEPDPKEPQAGDPLAKKRLHEIVYEYSGKEVSFEQLNDWSEFITFNNPNRESWEKTSRMLGFLNIRNGEVIADVGCGTGFFTFKFAEMVGRTGKVYATEINKEPLNYVDSFSARHGLDITTIQADLNDARLPEQSIDTIFMCSMYHAVYIASIEFVKDEFITSLKRALKPGGRLIVIDNAIASPGVIPYFGSGIAPELVIAQLNYYGFRLVDSRSFIPQRYVLIFKPD
jgi:SAM-dependent methyltransferase